MIITSAREPAIRLATQFGATHTVAALQNRKKFGFAIFETVFLRDRMLPATVLHAIRQAANSHFAERAIMFGYPWIPKRMAPDFIEILSPDDAYWRCICVLPDTLQDQRQLFMRRLLPHHAEMLLRIWRGKWTAEEVKLLHKIADGG
jgi:hypothetical protein